MFTVTQENPIQIIAYDLISCLGDLDERIIKLKNNQTHQNMIKMRDEIDGEYPYFKIDNTTKKHNTGAEIFYIDKAVSSVIKQSGFNNIKLSKTGIFLREITKRLMIGLEQEIPDNQERINHILKEQIFSGFRKSY